jgi:hypothetical protein
MEKPPKRKDLKFIIDNDFIFYIFPDNKSLFHGTISNTIKDPSKYDTFIKKIINTQKIPRSSIKDPLYLSTKTIADSYGCKRDMSYVVSALKDDIETPHIKNSLTKKQLCPLYYVDGEHGVTIEFIVKKPLKLFDIGNYKNISMLIETIKNSSTIDETKKEYFIETLNETCIHEKECNRRSTEWFDPDLVNLLCDFWKREKLPKMDGWIYFEAPNSKFHFEIMLCNPFDILELKKIHRVENTKYDGLMNWEDFRTKMTSQFKLDDSYNSVILTKNPLNIKIDYKKSKSPSPIFYDALADRIRTD